MIKTILKKVLEICFKAIINELIIEYQSRKEVIYEQTPETAEKGK